MVIKDGTEDTKAQSISGKLNASRGNQRWRPTMNAKQKREEGVWSLVRNDGRLSAGNELETIC
jgi:hypothetical protein